MGAGLGARAFWRLARPFSLPATLVPVLAGAAAGSEGGRAVALPLCGGMLAVALLLQIGTNAANEYEDYRRGLDDPSSVGIAGVLVRGELRPEVVRAVAWACYGAALVGGVLLAWARGWLLLPWGGAALALGYLYSGGPRPLSATPFGEALVFLAMGPAEVLASEYVAVGRVSPLAIAASVPVGCTVAAILLANNLRDVERDAARGRRTLAVLLGEAHARDLLRALVGAAFLWCVLGALLRILPWAVLATLLALPAALRAVGGTSPPLAPAGARANAVPAFGRLHLWLGLLLVAALLLGRLPTR